MKTWTTDISIPEEYSEQQGSFIRLREPNNAEWKVIYRLKKASGNMKDNEEAACDSLVEFCDLLKTLIVDHNLFNGERKMTAKEIAEYINGRNMLTIHVLSEYFQALPLAHASSTK